MDILETLNKEQREAVTHTDGPLLIIAGAGTGKTTVITRRIAHLMGEMKVPGDRILALTFTDKAAGEMEDRVEQLVPLGYVDFWISTFHAFGERIMKDHGLDIGLSTNFKLLTETEQWLLLRNNLEKLNLKYYKPSGNPTKFLQALVQHFSRLKDENISPQEYIDHAQGVALDADSDGTKATETAKSVADEAMRLQELAHAYNVYEQLLAENSALDFGDLIIKPIKLFQERPALLEEYREMFDYLLVDEFQDTNIAQYELVKMLAAPKNNLTVVADDDQAIYAFRGAAMSNILTFKEDFPEAHQVSLVENYRSGQRILDLSHRFIQVNNPNRLEHTLGIDKKLRSNIDDLGSVEHIAGQSLDRELQMIVEKIIALKDDETDWSDFAVLGRANDHIQQLIPIMEKADIPYQLVSMRGLYLKPLVVDMLSYLRLLDNYHEGRAMMRVMSSPVVDIAPEDMMLLTNHGRQYSQSLFETLRAVTSVKGLKEETLEKGNRLLGWIDAHTVLARKKPVGQVVFAFLNDSGLLKHVTNLPDGEATEQTAILNQFFKTIDAFERGAEDPSVSEFVAQMDMALEAGETGTLQGLLDEGPDSVKVLTIHAAKGLEWDNVFIMNMVDKRFPSIGRRMPIEIPEKLLKETLTGSDRHLEEERRLFYVACTRARKRLYFTSGEDYGGVRKKKPSRFLVESGLEPSAPDPDIPVQPQLVGATQPQVQTFVAPPPKHFSFTQLKAYESCPHQYKLQHVFKVPVPGRFTYSFGKSLHNALYTFFKRLQQMQTSGQSTLFGATVTGVPSLDDMMKLFEEHWISEWYESKKQEEEFRQKGRRALTDFYGKHEGKWPDVVGLEQGFTLKVGDYTLRGAIDRVDKLEDGTYEIVDYKTGATREKKEIDQLLVYALALEQVWGWKASKVSYYYLEDNVKVESEVTPEKMEKVQQWILSESKNVLSGDFTPKPGFMCKFCDFRAICEFRAN